MSANPTPTAPAPVVAPPSQTAATVDAVTDALAWGLSMAFPQLASVFAAGNEGLDKLVPWLIAVMEKKKFDIETLKGMQTSLNALGPSFPAAGGYSNVFAGGATPAPGTTPSQAPVNSATIVINGVTVTVSGDSLQAVTTFLMGMLAPKKP